MRVLHLGKFFPPYAGGIERFTALLLQALARPEELAQAALVHATPGHPRQSRQWIDPLSGAQLREVACHGRLLFAPLSPGWPLACQQMLREFRPDLLHVHMPNPSAFWLLAMARARRLPWLLHWHADVPADAQHLGVRLASRPYRVLERAMLARSAAIVATSAAYRDTSEALRPVRDKVRVIGLAAEPAPVDPATAEIAWPAQGLRVLAVGRLSYYKGFEVLLDALAHVPGCQLLLIGDGEQRSALETKAQRVGIAGRVRFAGSVDDATLNAAYRSCDLFCLPSLDRAEAFGLVLLEAMRVGKPVLASAIPGSGVGEVALAGDTALLVPPGDADALAAALRTLAADPALRARLGQAGFERWQQHYRPDAVATAMRALYRELVPG